MKQFTGSLFSDGEHIIYINGAYENKDDTSDLAKLIHDFRCKRADQMLLVPLADRTKFLKETPKGVESMCKLMEERVNDEKKRIAVIMLQDGKLTNDYV